MCSLVHVCDDKKRLGFMNLTEINQLELNPVINEKSETFKGMSNKKRATTIKKAQQKTNQREEILHQLT
jgi:3,4-dihydroxy-2-butanone 4-phosphate synthase